MGVVMQEYQRYGVFFTPTGALAQAGAMWLGWDIERGAAMEAIADPKWVKRPRKYGFHGTMKAPFALAGGCDAVQLQEGFARLCARQAPVCLEAVGISLSGGFLALRPCTEVPALSALAGCVVSGLDSFRAPASAAELERRRKSRLSQAQEAHLLKWGYPYVFDQFRFHMTLSGPLKGAQSALAFAAAKAYFQDIFSGPLSIDALSLVGERFDGTFEVIERRALCGAAV